MVLECLDGAFGEVESMIAGGRQLVIQVLGFDGCNEGIGCLIVESEKANSKASMFELIIAFGKSRD